MLEGYNTQQKIELISFLKSMQGKHVSVNQIVEHFADIDVQIGLTTIYRQLNKLVEQGFVKKYYIDDTAGSCFEYIDPEVTDDTANYFHLKCEECDNLIHFACQEVIELQEHVKAEHGFSIDPVRTVFYGTCAKCIKLKEKQKEKQNDITK